MPLVARLAAVYVSLVGLAVVIQFLSVPWRHPGGNEPYPIWEVLDYFMGAAILVAIVGALIAKRRHDASAESDGAAHVSVNTLFYAALSVGVIFFWNWGEGSSGADIITENVPILNDLFSGGSGGGNLLIWNFIDIALPVVLFASGRQIWRLPDAAPASEQAPPQGSPTHVGRILGAYVLLAAIVVAVKFIGETEWPGWTEINWLMGASVLISLVASVIWRVRHEAAGGAQGDVRRFLDANAPVQATAMLAIAFFFQWFATVNDHVQVEAIIGDRTSNIASLWAYIDTAFIVITAMVGARLWRGR